MFYTQPTHSLYTHVLYMTLTHILYMHTRFIPHILQMHKLGLNAPHFHPSPLELCGPSHPRPIKDLGGVPLGVIAPESLS